MKGYCIVCKKEVDEVDQENGKCDKCMDIIEFTIHYTIRFNEMDVKTQNNVIESICKRILKFKS